MKKILCQAVCAVFCVMLSPIVAKAQKSKTIELGAEISVQKNFNGGFNVGLESEVHSCRDFSMLEHYCMALHGGYAINSWLQAEAGYRFVNLNAEDRSSFAYQNSVAMHRLFAGLEGSVKTSNLTLSLRERYEFTIDPAKNVLRSRLKAGYDFTDHFAAFASFESLNNMTHYFRLSQTFTRIGFEWKVTDNHSIVLSGGYNGQDFLEEECGGRVELGYELTF